MDKQNVDYDYFLAEIYDYSPYFGKERRDKDYATPFYLNAIKHVKGTILEFVSCTGLLTIPLAKSGYKVESIDISIYMHAKIKEKLQNEEGKVGNNISLYCCDVFDYQSEKKYEAIVIPDSFLLAISDKEKQKQFLEKCYFLLENGGLLVFDIFKPWEDVIAKEEVKQCSRFRTKKGELFIVHTHHSICKKKQLHRFEFVHESYKDKSRYYHSIMYRYMYIYEIEVLLKQCGFELIYLDDKFNFGKNYAVIARKPFLV